VVGWPGGQYGWLRRKYAEPGFFVSTCSTGTILAIQLNLEMYNYSDNFFAIFFVYIVFMYVYITCTTSEVGHEKS
jgi:hypothetical protein